VNSSEWGNGGRVYERIVWRKYRSEETSKKNVSRDIRTQVGNMVQI
jgi:hypothetical protein